MVLLEIRVHNAATSKLCFNLSLFRNACRVWPLLMRLQSKVTAAFGPVPHLRCSSRIRKWMYSG